ncbi:hypothetical protein ACFQVD_43000 [Streptosporangium amethystogenes subsp. fukuiense]|uniref:Uncharacterized protein n=1 Tax=Streptosporangium amethystogenes subsp. fukuiense TaxID=698418 RepID=A0ABW2TGL1_9ACTN
MNRSTIAAGLITLGAVLAAPVLAAGPAHATASPSDPWDGLGIGIGDGVGNGMPLDYGNIGIGIL